MGFLAYLTGKTTSVSNLSGSLTSVGSLRYMSNPRPCRRQPLLFDPHLQLSIGHAEPLVRPDVESGRGLASFEATQRQSFGRARHSLDRKARLDRPRVLVHLVVHPARRTRGATPPLFSPSRRWFMALPPSTLMESGDVLKVSPITSVGSMSLSMMSYFTMAPFVMNSPPARARNGRCRSDRPARPRSASRCSLNFSGSDPVTTS